MIAPSHKSWSTDAHCRIEAAAQHQLQNSGYYALRRVSCRLQGNTLRLGGRVSSYYEKQLAQSLVLQELDEDANIVLENQLEVANR